MTITSSGQITLADLQSEFGGSNPIGINEYYAGGSYVIAGQRNGSDVAIPSSGQISLNNFYGTQKWLEAWSLTAGEYNLNYVGDPYNDYENVYDGFISGSIGSISPSTSHIYGSSVTQLYTNYDKGYTGGGGTTLIFGVSGASNSGWTTLNIHGFGTFNRASASFSSGVWTWSAGSSLSNGANYIVSVT